jgi:hypothetical protein
MTQPATIQDMLPSEVAFVAAMQQLGFGRFEYLQIRGGELVLNPWPAAVRDIKFAAPPNTGKPSETNSELRPQVADFFAYVRDVDAGEIRELEVRHGLPFSMEVELAGAKADARQGGRRG